MESKLMELHDKYHHIGEGWCGVVFQHPDRPFAVKIYKTPSTSPDFNHATFEPGCLGQDFNQHRKLVKAWDPSIQARMDGLPILPRLDSFISPRHNVRWPEDRKTSLGLDWQAFETSRLDDRWQKLHGNDVLVTERIPPINDHFRDLLISKFCPTKLVEGARQNERNQDCLVRCYLGRRRRTNKNSCLRSRAFGLRNYPLHLDQMEQLDLRILTFAKQMARALAVSHWRALVNINDSEFVLGGPPTHRQGQNWRPPQRSADGYDQGAELWLLDFDKSVSITFDEAGAKSAAHAAFHNDPYFPKVVLDSQLDVPVDKMVDESGEVGLEESHLDNDHALWCQFKLEYLKSSGKIFDEQGLGAADDKRKLPCHMMQEWMRLAEEKLQKAQKSSPSLEASDGPFPFILLAISLARWLG